MTANPHQDYLSGAETHEVFNVPEPLEDYSLYQQDRFLQQLVHTMGADWAEPELQRWGRKTGSAELLRQGLLANQNPPRFQSHDPYGHRIERVEYHPAYHRLMSESVAQGLPSFPWRNPGPGAQVYRAALLYQQAQMEQGHCCPLTMTYASVPSLKIQPNLAEKWLPGILSTTYDPRDLPMEQKHGLTIGMAMTEKQGGSDVRANTTRAQPVNARGAGQAYQLVGHKFFMSAPMSDAFLFLAQAEDGLSCFLVPRWHPDGERNGFRIQRLKDKMGNVSNASSEVELRGALGWLIGEEGRGVANVMAMAGLTRFDCMTASAGAMRQAVVQAVHHCYQRRAFGKPLVDQPLMQNVLADLVVESDAALVLSMRMARALDREDDDSEKALLRLGTAVGKYWVCKRTPGQNYEAMECLGGSGVMNEFMTSRLYREAPINAIWEGSGNIQCLDVLRVLERQPECVDALEAELARTKGVDKRLDRQLGKVKRLLNESDGLAYRARTLVESIALAWQGSLLLRHGDARVAEAFIASRLEEPAGLFGNLPRGLHTDAIISRALPMYE